MGEDQNSTLEACSGTVPKLKSLGKETNSGEELSGIAMDHLQTTREEDIALVSYEVVENQFIFEN